MKRIKRMVSWSPTEMGDFNAFLVKKGEVVGEYLIKYREGYL